eukprot:5407664-Pyramimonas_sp.AAC.1
MAHGLERAQVGQHRHAAVEAAVASAAILRRGASACGKAGGDRRMKEGMEPRGGSGPGARVATIARRQLGVALGGGRRTRRRRGR